MNSKSFHSFRHSTPKPSQDRPQTSKQRSKHTGTNNSFLMFDNSSCTIIRLSPVHRPDPRLVGQRVRVLHPPPPELRHDEVDALLHLLLVGIAHLGDVREGDAVGAEEDVDLGGGRGVLVLGLC